jgi:hypothetical protein
VIFLGTIVASSISCFCCLRVCIDLGVLGGFLFVVLDKLADMEDLGSNLADVLINFVSIGGADAALNFASIGKFLGSFSILVVVAVTWVTAELVDRGVVWDVVGFLFVGVDAVDESLFLKDWRDESSWVHILKSRKVVGGNDFVPLMLIRLLDDLGRNFIRSEFLFVSQLFREI